MFDIAMLVLLVFVAAAVGETAHFEDQFIENMIHGVGVFAVLFAIVVCAISLIGPLVKGKKDSERRREQQDSKD